MGGGGGSLQSTNAITPAEASADYAGAAGQAQAPGGVWAAPSLQQTAGFAAAPTVDAYFNPTAGVATGIPQGGFAAPSIAQYLTGTGAGPQVSYQAGQHDPWLGQVEGATQYNQNVLRQQAAQQEAARQAAEAGVPLPDAVPQQPGSALRADEFAALQEAAAAGDQVAADTLYNNQLANVDASGGADAGGLWSSIRGHGDQAGSSLATGSASNVGLQDRAIALGETVGQFSPLVGGVTGLVSDRIAPADENRAETAGPRTALEVSIDRHTDNWARQAPDNDAPHMTHQEILDAHALQRNRELGYSSTPSQSAAAAGFDMNDPSTWISDTDSRERNDGGNDNDGGSSDAGGK